MLKSFITIGVNSIDESLSFYTDVLGFSLENRVNPDSDVELLWLKNESGLIVELVHNKKAPIVRNEQSSLSLSFQVDNLDDKVEVLEKYAVPYETMDIPGVVTFKRFKDPNGISLVFLKTFR